MWQAITAASRISVGRRAILPGAELAGTVTSVSRINQGYWAVTMRTGKDAFRNPAIGVSASVWIAQDGQFMVDYWMRDGRPCEAGQCRTLEAALGVAIDSCARRYRG
jgi:hypothetical protein